MRNDYCRGLKEIGVALDVIDCARMDMDYDSSSDDDYCPVISSRIFYADLFETDDDTVA